MQIMPKLESFRQRMSGLAVIDVLSDSDGLGISFEDDWHLTVWSGFRLRMAKQEIDLSHVDELIGSCLTLFEAQETIELLQFSQGLEIIVGLDDRDPSHPEAMMLRGPNSLIVVWNE
jgi:hypothetical protein